MQPPDQIKKLLEEISATLKNYSKYGLKGYDCSAVSLSLMDRWPSIPTGGSQSQVTESLHGVKADLTDCRRCGLHEERQRIVFGAGDPHATLMFIGEGPGREEDLRGEPFVGAAGELLTKIIQAIHLTRETVYICNIVKCRPPKTATRIRMKYGPVCLF